MSSANTKDNALVKERLNAILTYLQKSLELELTPNMRIEQHLDFSINSKQIIALPGVRYLGPNTDSGVWIEIERLIPSEPPTPPKSILELIELSPQPNVNPILHKERIQLDFSSIDNNAPDIEAQKRIATAKHKKACANAELVFQKYVETTWQSWSESEKQVRRTVKLYNDIFSFYRKAKSDSSANALELVLGIGTVQWKHEVGNLNYPLLTQRCEILIDEKTKRIHISPTEQNLIFESSGLRKLQVEHLEEINDRFTEWAKSDDNQFHPFTPETYLTFLNVAVSLLHPTAVLITSGAEKESSHQSPRIVDEWNLFIRPRGANALLEDVKNIKQQILTTEEIQGAAAVLVDDPEDTISSFSAPHVRGLLGEHPDNSSGRADPFVELYFPLPYNNEQLHIVNLLDQSDGVVVQGPPGTGKTHTIANIICHYLAEGKRILVTSKGEPALSVIRNKIPAEVRQLVVSMLTNEKEGLKQLEDSIKHIAEQVSFASEAEIKEEIKNSKASIDRCHRTITKCNSQLKDIAASQLTEIVVGNSSTYPYPLAREVLQQKEKYQWFSDNLKEYLDSVIPFDQQSLATFLSLRDSIQDKLDYLDCDLPIASQIPEESQIVGIHEALTNAKNLDKRSLENSYYKLTAENEASIVAGRTLRDLTRAAQHSLSQIDFYKTTSWHFALREICLDPAFATLKTLLQPWSNEVLELFEDRQATLSDTFEMPNDAELNLDFIEAIHRAKKGEKPFGLFDFGKKSAKILLNQARINNKPLANQSDFEKFSEYLRITSTIKSLTQRWNILASEFIAPTFAFEENGKTIKELRVVATVIQTVSRLIEIDFPNINAQARIAFGESWKDLGFIIENEVLKKIADSIEVALPRLELTLLEEAHRLILKVFESYEGKIFADSIKFLENTIGNPEKSTDLVLSEWLSLKKELLELCEAKPKLHIIKNTISKVAAAGAKLLAVNLSTKEFSTCGLEAEILPAWEWRLKVAHLGKLQDLLELEKECLADRRTAEKSLAKHYAKLVRSNTWLNIKRKLTNRLKSALQSYLNAIKGMGRGTSLGKRTARHRQDAQTAMSEAYQAVPCWIMPHRKISEIMPAALGAFDLVIIDEASQSDIDAFPAIIRGKKLLVVGDDEQISPSSFEKEDDLKKIMQEVLKPLPHNFKAQLAPEKSIYDYARVAFPGASVMLREHFRCVASIIDFSNRLSYNGKIECLRVPKPSERLEPPLIARFIEDGYRQGNSKLNPAEIDAIIAELDTINKEPKLKKKSIGIISLIGSHQALVLQQKILETFGEAFVERHDIICGDSMTFQGNERDIIILSMVADGSDTRMVRDRKMRQRYNVAASRARDRMYLFYSVDRAQLKEEDLKARLIDHFLGATESSTATEIAKLRELCDSSFEVEMFDELIARGYRVTPQVQSGSYTIDFVVEGQNDMRLAIECDGDEYHGIDKQLEDYQRQRILERAGWQFWRCWGSTFFLNREKCLEDLTRVLTQLEIYPIGREDEFKTAHYEYATQPTAKSKEALSIYSDATVELAHAESIQKEHYSHERVNGRLDIGETAIFENINNPSDAHKVTLVEGSILNLDENIIGVQTHIGSLIVSAYLNSIFSIDFGRGMSDYKLVEIEDLDEEIEEIANHDTLIGTQSSASFLCEYISWTQQAVPDPRYATTADVAKNLLAIIATEAPIMSGRLYQIYSRAAGIGRLSADMAELLEKAIASCVRKGTVIKTNELSTRKKHQQVLTMPGRTPSKCRIGIREFDEIPPSELAIVIREVQSMNPRSSLESIFRETLKIFDKRLNMNTRERLALTHRKFVDEPKQSSNMVGYL
jgi:very-short-patch-repair endonuclease